MDDYISREAAKKEIVEFWEVMPQLKHCQENQLKRINSVPAADVRPVVHGKWKKSDEYENTWECSACGELWELIDGTPVDNGMKFCPACGAQMDGTGGDAK